MRGAVGAWGRNNSGQLGIESSEEVAPHPIQVASLKDVIAIAAGGNHSLALKRDGTLWAWGYNFYGQLGDGSADNRPTPVRVAIP